MPNNPRPGSIPFDSFITSHPSSPSPPSSSSIMSSHQDEFTRRPFQHHVSSRALVSHTVQPLQQPLLGNGHISSTSTSSSPPISRSIQITSGILSDSDNDDDDDMKANGTDTVAAIIATINQPAEIPPTIPSIPPTSTSHPSNVTFAPSSSFHARIPLQRQTNFTRQQSIRAILKVGNKEKKMRAPMDSTLSSSHTHATHPMDDNTTKRKEALAKGGSGTWTWRGILDRLPYYIPILTWAPRYQKEMLIGDILAAFSVAALLIPQSVAYASLAQLPPIHGLYTAFFALIVYGILGSSRHLQVGPEATSSILIGQTILSAMSNTDPNDPTYMDRVLSTAVALTCLIGLITLLMGLLRLGFLDSILSRPVLAGFLLALAIVLIIEQLVNALGLPECHTCSARESAIDKLIYAFKHMDHIHGYTVAVSITCFICFFGMRMLKQKYSQNMALICVPDILIVIVLVTGISYAADFQSLGIRVLGKMDYGFRAPILPNLVDQQDLTLLISSAMTITILGFVESQLISKKYATTHAYSVSPNRELVAFGMSSIVASFFGGFSAYGSFTRSKLNDSAGGRSQLVSFLVAILILLAILVLLPFFQYLPKAATAALIVSVALGLIEIHEIRFIIRVHQWRDLIMLIGMAIATLVLGVDIGVFLALGVCLLLVVKQTSLPGVTLLGRGYKDDDFHDMDDLDEDVFFVEGILIYKIDGPLFFANAEKLKDSTRRVEAYGDMHIHPSLREAPLQVTAIIFDLTSLTTIDSSSLSIFVEIVSHYRQQGRRVCFVKLKKHHDLSFQRAGLITLVGRENVFRNLEDAVRAIQDENLFSLFEAPTIHSIQDVLPARSDSMATSTPSHIGTPNSRAMATNDGSPSMTSISIAGTPQMSASPLDGGMVVGSADSHVEFAIPAPLDTSSSSQSVTSASTTPKRSKKSAFKGAPLMLSPLLRRMRKLSMDKG